MRHGELVRLRAGGPIMIVYRVRKEEAHCLWQGSDGRVYRGSFSRSLLDRVHAA